MSLLPSPPLDHPQSSQYKLLFDTIQARLAFVLDERHRADVIHAIEVLVRAEGIGNLQELTRQLTEQPTTTPLWQKLIHHITIGKTYFFRDRGQINALWHSVLPALIERRRQTGCLQLRLWSAGCSTGEEPYTLAILLRELLPDYRAWDLTILATDLNLSYLEHARKGVYRRWSFPDEESNAICQRWFVATPGGYQLDRSICDMVTFAPLNLVSNDYPSPLNGTNAMDIILCRNVLIYFDDVATSAVIARLHKALNPEGWLVLGHAETGHVTGTDFEPALFEKAVLYRKHLPNEPTSEVIEPDTPKFEFTLDQPEPKLLRKLPLPEPLPSPNRDQPEPIELIEEPPQSEPWDLALQAADKEHWQAALSWLAKAEKKHKMHAEVHYLRGMIQFHQAELENALASLRRALYCDSRFVLARFVLGEIYEKLGQFQKALSEWNQARTILDALPPDASIAFSGDLTVEMLSRLLQYRLDKLSTRNQGARYAAS